MSETLARLGEAGAVPVLRAPTAEVALRAAEALVEGGVKALEVTFTVPGAEQVLTEAARRYPHLLLGAGTVLDEEVARRALAAGARFIVSPVVCEALLRLSSGGGVDVIPGAASPTEVYRAMAGGATVVKVFPASCLGGPAYLRALRGPFPAVRLLPTGGVKVQDIPAYLEAGAFAVGMGSELLGHLRDDADFAAITARTREVMAVVESWRQLRGHPLSV